MRVRRFLVPASLLLVLFSLPGWPAQDVQAATQQASAVQISPVHCCQGASLYSEININVILTLAPGESIDGFDVRINYTNPHTNSITGVLKAESIDYSTNIFSMYNNNILVDCIDGISVQSGGNGCPVNGPGGDSPNPGQLHLTEGIIGQSVSTSGLLFSIRFQVTGFGQSIFTIDRANIVNPHGDPSNPQSIIPVYIPVVKQDGVFGNQGVVAFFNYGPDDTSITPAALPNQQVDFDASGSFVATNSSLGFRLYAWNFGDGTPENDMTSPSVHHVFAQPGNYTVSLTVSDQKNENGTVTRTVDVSRALGNLLLTVEDQLGTVLRGSAVVKLFNSSSSTVPFVSQTTDNSGDILFYGLSPSDSYYLTFSGPTVENASKTESVLPGFTRMDTVNLPLRPAPADYSGLIYIGSILAGLGIVTGAIVYKKRPSANGSPRRAGRGVKSRSSHA